MSLGALTREHTSQSKTTFLIGRSTKEQSDDGLPARVSPQPLADDELQSGQGQLQDLRQVGHSGLAPCVRTGQAEVYNITNRRSSSRATLQYHPSSSDTPFLDNQHSTSLHHGGRRSLHVNATPYGGLEKGVWRFSWRCLAIFFVVLAVILSAALAYVTGKPSFNLKGVKTTHFFKSVKLPHLNLGNCLVLWKNCQT